MNMNIESRRLVPNTRTRSQLPTRLLQRIGFGAALFGFASLVGGCDDAATTDPEVAVSSDDMVQPQQQCTDMDATADDAPMEYRGIEVMLARFDGELIFEDVPSTPKRKRGRRR
jgi:hypothetical protein